MNRNLKGIEPIIAVVILVAVTLIIAIAVVGWIMGWWGATTSPVESLKVTPVSATSRNITLVICNTGTADSTIDRVVILGVGEGQPNKDNIKAGKCETVTIDVGSDLLSAGKAYEVTIVTAAGNTYKTVVRAS